MIALSQSLLLQALGWATLNSFWQVGLLWCVFATARRFAPLSPARQFQLASAGIFLGLGSFLLSLWWYMQPGAVPLFGTQPLNVGGAGWLPLVLTAASMTYLVLLIVPATRLARNWAFLRHLRRKGLKKAPVQYRLFVQNISGRLGLHRPVQVFLSQFVTSPLTIGFFKPLILLPVAGFNQLSVRQAEAILLHELAHIRRFDFLVNIGIACTQTLLYFNPFIQLFVQVAQSSREASCDHLVLQFGYDRVAYASALLRLEETAAPRLSLAAASKGHLLSRVQTILGIGTGKPVLRLQHFAGLAASLLCIVALHSVFVPGRQGSNNDGFHAVTSYANPFQLAFTNEDEVTTQRGNTVVRQLKNVKQSRTTTAPAEPEVPPAELWAAPPPAPVQPQFIQVARKEVATLSAAERQQVKEMISTTRDVLGAYEWQQLEKDIADGLTAEEKEAVKLQYQQEVAGIDWEQLEENLARNFGHADLQKIRQYLKSAQEGLHRDSLEQVYSALLAQLEVAPKAAAPLPLPDVTTGEIETIKLEIRKVRDSLITTRTRPVISL